MLSSFSKPQRSEVKVGGATLGKSRTLHKVSLKRPKLSFVQTSIFGSLMPCVVYIPVNILNVGKVGGLKVSENGAGILYGGQSGERERLARHCETQVCLSFI